MEGAVGLRQRREVALGGERAEMGGAVVGAEAGDRFGEVALGAFEVAALTGDARRGLQKIVEPGGLRISLRTTAMAVATSSAALVQAAASPDASRSRAIW